jgi:protein SCO1/2
MSLAQKAAPNSQTSFPDTAAYSPVFGEQCARLSSRPWRHGTSPTLSSMLSARARLALFVLALLALGGAIAVTIAARTGDDGAAAEVTEVEGFQGPRSPFEGALRPPAPANDFALSDQDGEPVALRDLRGRIVVLTPMYTTCEDTCPLVAQQIRGALDDLSAEERAEITALALSVDPANDTPESARRFLITRRVRGHLDFLVGSERELRPVWRSYGFSPQTERREHNSHVVLIDRRGRQRVGFPVNFLTPEALAHDLRVLLREHGA